MHIVGMQLFPDSPFGVGRICVSNAVQSAGSVIDIVGN